MTATVLRFPKAAHDLPPATRIYLDLPPRFSARGSRYNVRLASSDGEIIVTDSLTPLYDSARVLFARGYSGRLEMWDAERPYARMGGDIAKLAGLTVENETHSPRIVPWKAFPVRRYRPKTAKSGSGLPSILKPKRPLASEVRAMRNFSKVGISVWTSDKFCSLPSDDGRLLFFYALTAPHSNLIGCYRLHESYAAVDLKWTVEQYRKARGELVAVDLVRFDPKTMTVMIPRWWRFNAITSPSHNRLIMAEISRIPVPEFRESVLAEYSELRGEQPSQNPISNGNGIAPHLMTPHLGRARG